jgi:hypothetical protein
VANQKSNESKVGSSNEKVMHQGGMGGHAGGAKTEFAGDDNMQEIYRSRKQSDSERT